MKHFTGTLIFFFVIALSFGQIANDDRSFFDYTYDKNLIKRNKVETAIIEMFFSDGKKMGKQIYHFDKEGLLKTETILDSTGILRREFLFKSNLQNDLILRIENDFENKRKDSVAYFKFYESGKLISDSSSILPVKNNFEYNNNGELIKIIIRSNWHLYDNTKKIIINTFDSTGRIVNIKETVYQNDSTENQFSNRDILYNKAGKIEKEIEKLNSENSWMANKGSSTYNYNTNGSLTEIVRASAASYYYGYNENGLIITKKMIMPSEISEIETIDKYNYTYWK